MEVGSKSFNINADQTTINVVAFDNEHWSLEGLDCVNYELVQ